MAAAEALVPAVSAAAVVAPATAAARTSVVRERAVGKGMSVSGKGVGGWGFRRGSPVRTADTPGAGCRAVGRGRRSRSAEWVSTPLVGK
ncbi:hypothetical protein GCM10010502_57120 [Kitasatospora aureofaciens]|uniref:Uncharacterized protein n=1 Tax=Kitasatospora aureofaciens TaxID=1894 RepID=A0A8H9I1E8_KITAU|nr:hypothetical protein GCM10010502_57120 [Kitasatospora aureofaciens]